MNIYFSCSITGGRADQRVYQQIVDYLVEQGHDVPTAHLASSNLAQLETKSQPEEIYRRDIDWVRGCDALIAEVSTPSHGVGYEIAEAAHHGKRVLCLYRQGTKVSKILTGNSEAKFAIRAYQSQAHLQDLIAEFLAL